MKVADYVKAGLKNFVDSIPEGFKPLGKAKEGCHRVEFYVKEEGGIIKEAVFNSSKRCKKLLALADLVAERMKGKKLSDFKLEEEALLETFKEEKDKKKLKERIELIKKAFSP